MSIRIRAEVLKELYETTNTPGYSFLFASTSKSDDSIHVKADISDDDAMNVALAILRRLAETYTVESILREIKNNL